MRRASEGTGRRFKVFDTGHAGHVVLDMPFADLYFNGSGATVQPTITQELVDRAFGERDEFLFSQVECDQQQH